MNRIGYFLLNIAVTVYIFSNGIMAIHSDHGGEYGTFVRFIFGSGDFSNTFLIFIAVSAFIAGFILLLSLVKIKFPFTDSMLFFYGIGWISFIVVMDIVYPFLNKIELFAYLKIFATHLMVQGTLFTAIKRLKHNE